MQNKTIVWAEHNIAQYSKILAAYAAGKVTKEEFISLADEITRNAVCDA